MVFLVRIDDGLSGGHNFLTGQKESLELGEKAENLRLTQVELVAILLDQCKLILSGFLLDLSLLLVLL